MTDTTLQRTVAAALLVLVAAPVVATAQSQPDGVFTVFRVLVGKSVASQTGPARVAVVPGPFVFLGKSPEQDARDVLQLMAKLKESYGLAEMSVSTTLEPLTMLHKEVEIPMPAQGVAVHVTLLGFDAATASYRVRIAKQGEEPSEANVVVNRGERGLLGTRDGAEAPYLFLTVEPMLYRVPDLTAPAVMAKLTQRVVPTYPEEARKARFQGVVVLEASIGADGVVRALKPLRAEPMGLTEAAVEAVKQWRYEPARDAAGKPIEARLDITVSFTLYDDEPPAGHP